MVKRIIKSVKNTLFPDQSLVTEDRYLINKPFYFSGANGRAILLIHGWSSTPYEVRKLGRYLNQNGYTVNAPRLRGHGTIPKDLENVRWIDWLEDLDKEYAELKKSHRKVFIAGTSIGANLAILLAARNGDVPALVLMATPYNIKMEKLALIYAKSVSFFKSYNKKFYPPTFGISTSLTRLISYQTYPIKSAIESFELIKNCRQKLYQVTQPCFLLQSESDHIIGNKSLEKIYNEINSEIKKRKYVKRAYHTFVSDPKQSYIFEDILNFLNEN